MAKKILFTLAFITLCFLGMDQAFSQYFPEPIGNYEVMREKTDIALKSSENILFYEDFNGAIPASWKNLDLAGFCSFKHTYLGPQGPLSIGMPPLSSTTAGNGFVILDSDLCSSQNPGGLTDAYIETPAINLQGAENLMLRFQHNFRYCCSPQETMIAVEVSTDYVNWYVYDVRNGLPPNNISPNPRYQSVNISAVAAGHEKVWVRFRKSGASHYWWMIDDVMLVSFVDNDLEITAVEYNNGYTQIPDGQQKAFTFKSKVRNAGGLDQTNVVLKATVNRYLFSSSSLPVSKLASGQEINMLVQQSFIPEGRGLFNVEFSVSQDQNDQVPESNIRTGAFYITDSVYSRSTSQYDTGSMITLTAGNTIAAGTRFTIVNNMEATSASFVLNESTVAGAQVQVKLFRQNASIFEEMGASEIYTILDTDVSSEGNVSWVSVNFTNPANLQPGEYIGTVHRVNGSVTLAAQPYAGQPMNSSYRNNSGTWEPLDMVPMVNLNFGKNVGECRPMVHFIVESALCGTANGSIEAYPLTGIGPYQFEWAHDPGLVSPLVENLASGEYTVTITDAYGCALTRSATVKDEDIKVEYESTTAFCSTNGVVSVLVLNGEGPYSYSWSHDAELNDAVANNLAPGVYTVIVTDANNCQGVVETQVDNIAELPVDVVVQDAFCGASNGMIQLTPVAGVAPFGFVWDGFEGIDDSTLSDLKSGTYTFKVNDNNNCIFSGTAVVVDQNYTLNINSSVVNASCGESNATVNLNVPNGYAPYTYAWSNGMQGPSVSNLAPGNYLVSVNDNYGCKGSLNVAIQNAGTLPQLTWESVNSSGCGESNGSVSIIQDNPAASYTYQILSDDKSGFPQITTYSHKNGADFYLDNLAAGSYRVSITSDSGCEKIVSLDVSDEGGPELVSEVEMISCFGQTDGSVSVSLANAGTDPQYQWDDPAGSTAPSIGNLAAGWYTVHVTDQGCTSVSSFEIKEPKRLLANATIQQNLCSGQDNASILLSMIGGTSPYSFIWNTGSTNRNIFDLQPGNYTVTITDYHYCTFVKTYQILDAPDPVVVNYLVEHTTDGQDNGSILLSASGGVGNFTYSWNTGQTTSLITGLAAGTYIATVTDGNNCEVAQSVLVGFVNVPMADKEEKLKLFPNPAKEKLFMDFRGGCLLSTHLEVFNMLGEMVLSERVPVSNDGEISAYELNISRLNPGMYFMRLNCEGKIWQAKFLKQ